MNKKYLLIPGPVTTSDNVKKLVSQDYGSREINTINIIKKIRKQLLSIQNISEDNYSSILFQGTGTYAVEAVLSSLPPESNLLILSNGVYGNRINDIAKIYKINLSFVKINFNRAITLDLVKNSINNNITHVAMVHNETTSGVLNPIEDIIPYLKKKNIKVIIDAISSFGGIPINYDKLDIDYLISSSNKCLEAFPGISFVIVKKKLLINDYSRSYSLSLYQQWLEFENNNQFRFTPPVQIIMSLCESLEELIKEGGITARYKRYKYFNNFLNQEIEKLGIKNYINQNIQGPITSTFYFPKNKNYENLRLALYKKNITIYKSSIINENVFRIGTIGALKLDEFKYCVECLIKELRN